jgi:hypothetical protein
MLDNKMSRQVLSKTWSQNSNRETDKEHRSNAREQGSESLLSVWRQPPVTFGGYESTSSGWQQQYPRRVAALRCRRGEDVRESSGRTELSESREVKHDPKP